MFDDMRGEPDRRKASRANEKDGHAERVKLGDCGNDGVGNSRHGATPRGNMLAFYTTHNT